MLIPFFPGPLRQGFFLPQRFTLGLSFSAKEQIEQLFRTVLGHGSM
jgi:hypothetical protein